MKTFRVTFVTVYDHYQSTIVEAETEEEAREIAEQLDDDTAFENHQEPSVIDGDEVLIELVTDTTATAA